VGKRRRPKALEAVRGERTRGEPGPELNSRNRKTLELIFENSTRADIRWDDIERLFRALGGYVDNKRKGSRVGVSLRGVRALFHEPQPDPNTDKGAVRSVREFLIKCGVQK
jgi:hypothetical protein